MTARISVFALLVFFVAAPCEAKLLITAEEALELFFPAADDIEKKHVFLSESQTEEARKTARAEIKSRLYTFYVVRSEGRRVARAVIDTHRLRTLTETVMFVISPDGKLVHTEVLAFFEPPDYMPNRKWLNIFSGKSVDSRIVLDSDIPNVTGATITADSFSRAARRALALHEVVFGGASQKREAVEVGKALNIPSD